MLRFVIACALLILCAGTTKKGSTALHSTRKRGDGCVMCYDDLVTSTWSPQIIRRNNPYYALAVNPMPSIYGMQSPYVKLNAKFGSVPPPGGVATPAEAKAMLEGTYASPMAGANTPANAGDQQAFLETQAVEYIPSPLRAARGRLSACINCQFQDEQ